MQIARTSPPSPTPADWRLQDAKAQFSELVDNALRGVPQHVTRRGKRAVVVLSESDFEALQRSAASRADAPISFIQHLLGIPKLPPQQDSPLNFTPSLDMKPRDLDFS
jgi:antitoxin Phd